MDFNVLVPVVRAGKDKRGRVIIHGVASDASVDLQGEITEPSGLKSSLPYFRKFGKFNDDHKPVNVGEVTEAEIVSKGELVKRGILDANEMPDDAKRDEVLYVKGSRLRLCHA